MILHPVILLPKLVVIMLLVVLLTWLHGVLSTGEWLVALLGSIVFLALFSIFMMWLVGRLASKPGSRIGRSFVLQERSDASEGFVAANPAKKSLVGKRGIALCMLRPAGKVQIDGLRVDAVTEGDFIPRGCEVEVLKVEGNRVIVKSRERASWQAEAPGGRPDE